MTDLKVHYFYSSKTQFENIGDALIARELLCFIRKRASDFYVDDRSTPEHFKKLINLMDQESSSKRGAGFKRKIIKDLLTRKNCVYVFKPGHIFKSKFSISDLVYYLFFIALGLLGLRYVQYGCSIGPLDKWNVFFSRLMNPFYLDRTAREDYSIDFLKENLIDPVRYFPDLAFLLKFRPRLGNDEGFFCFSFRTGTINMDDHGYTAKIEKILLNENLPFLSSRKIKVCSQVERDSAYMRSLAKLFSVAPDNKVFFDDHVCSVDVFLDFYNNVDFVLSNRLHVLLSAASRGAIPIALIDKNTHTKITGIFEKVGLSDLIVDINEPENAVKNIQVIFESKQIFNALLQNVFDSVAKTISE